MGLDMFFFRQPVSAPAPGSEGFNDESLVEIQYFRKHSDLHGFLEEIWVRAHPEEEFNCVFMPITEEVLKDIQYLVDAPDKQKYEGFFWGESMEEQWEKTKELLPKIARAIGAGDRVFYYSWW